MQQITIKDIDDLDRAAEEFMPLLAEHRVFAFYGGMGSGKTTFISALCRRMGVTDDTASPTFAIVNEYHIPQSHDFTNSRLSNDIIAKPQLHLNPSGILRQNRPAFTPSH